MGGRQRNSWTTGPKSSGGNPSEETGQLLVNTCGQTLAIDEQSGKRLLDLQKTLQLELQMEVNHTFEFFDVNGARLSTDAEVQDAIVKQQTPLFATLTDMSIHLFQNQQDDMSQTSWKLLKAQLVAATGKIAALDKQVNETQTELEQFKQESATLMESVHKERQLDQRASTVPQLLSGGHEKRDIALQGIENIEKQLTVLRQMLESERDNRQLAMESTAKDVKVQVLQMEERCAALENRFTDLSNRQAVTVNRIAGGQEHVLQVMESLRDQEKKNENTSQYVKVQVLNMDERCVALENRIAEVSSRQNDTVKRLAGGQEHVLQVVESLRDKEKQNESQIGTALARMKELESRRAQMAMISEQKSLHMSLEEKDRSDQESRNLDHSGLTISTQTISEEVGKSTPRVDPPGHRGPRRLVSGPQESPKVMRRSVSGPRRSISGSPTTPASTSRGEVMILTTQGIPELPGPCYSPKANATPSGPVAHMTALTAAALQRQVVMPPQATRWHPDSRACCRMPS